MNQFLGNEFNKETTDAVYFYTPVFYALDNFSAYVVEIWNKKFPTSEHAYQWKKYADTYPDIAEEIFNATSPSQVKKIADAHKAEITPKFHEIKFEIMEEILHAKVAQHEKVRRTLLDTGTREIIENSPVDPIWGIGPEGNGQNMLGKIWTKIRQDIS
ncbi:MAG: NADAR family protein [Candidatus Pacebacteria bacterium]|nr:NADAR family protein [Candidatus Paceibacterota bacterium]